MAVLSSPIRSPIRSPIYSPTVGAWGGTDALAAWIGASTYADFNAKMLDRQFQESTGQTAVTASADKVGLWLDGAQWGGKTLTALLAGQPELVTNSTFDIDLSGWTDGDAGTGDSSYAAGTMKLVGTSSGNRAVRSQALTTVVGRTYRVTASRVLNSGEGAIGASTTTGATSSLGGVVMSAWLGGFVFTASSTTTYINIYTGGSGGDFNVDVISVKEIPGYHGLNATAAQRLNLLISGTRYTLTGDGADDNLLTPWLAAASGNTKIANATSPASLAAVQIISGAQSAGGDRWRMGVNTSGFLCGGVGINTEVTVVGTRDTRGKDFVAALTEDGSTLALYLYMDGVASTEYTGARSSLIPSATPMRLGANNNNGTGLQFFAGGINRNIDVQKATLLSFADFQNIAAQLAREGA